MANFFSNILHFSYSSGLNEHLKGLDILKCDAYSGTNIYAWIAIWTLFMSFILMFNYYYGIFNRPNCSKFWVWLLNVLIGAITILLMAYMRTNGDLRHGKFCKDLQFNSTDCMLFACTYAVYTVVLCGIFSLVMKWWSRNNKKVPF